jgi:hypothetical protein
MFCSLDTFYLLHGMPGPTPQFSFNFWRPTSEVTINVISYVLALNTLSIQLCPWPLFVHEWVLTSQSIILNSVVDPRSGMLCSMELRLRVAHSTVEFMTHMSVHRYFARISRPFVYPVSIHFSARKNHKSAEYIDLKVILRWRFGRLTTWDSPHLRRSEAKACLVYCKEKDEKQC